MNLKRLVCLVLAFGAASDLHARVYKTVDEEGNVIYTDVPPKQDSKRITIDTPNVFNPALPTVAPPPADEEPVEEEKPAVSYKLLRIVSPKDDEGVRENAGNINVTVNSNPNVDIDNGHSLEILVDGAVHASGTATSFELSSVDRGTHTLTARIVDANGNVLISADTITFHMLRISQLTRPQQFIPRNPSP